MKGKKIAENYGMVNIPQAYNPQVLLNGKRLYILMKNVGVRT